MTYLPTQPQNLMYNLRTSPPWEILEKENFEPRKHHPKPGASSPSILIISSFARAFLVVLLPCEARESNDSMDYSGSGDRDLTPWWAVYAAPTRFRPCLSFRGHMLPTTSHQNQKDQLKKWKMKLVGAQPSPYCSLAWHPLINLLISKHSPVNDRYWTCRTG